MLIGALQRFSLLDYPGKISCIVFTQGCNFRCPYCHNPELVSPESFQPVMMPRLFFDFLAARTKKIDGVVITGGEPTIQSDIVDFIKKIKEMGFLVKLDTNGSRPEILSSLLEQGLLDYIAMDIKAPPRLYAEVTGVAKNGMLAGAVTKSIRAIIDSGVGHEFRTTVVRDLLDAAQIVEIAGLARGAARYVLQRFVPSKTLDHRFMDYASPEQSELDELAGKIEALKIPCSVR
jgi:pyruvate formate lyase activating enzyme